MCQTLGISERRACRVLGQHRSTQRKPPQGREDEARLTADVIELAREYGRYGYRRVAALLRRAGWQVNHKRVARIWRREGLKVPHKQKKRGRLWLAPLVTSLRDALSGSGRLLRAAEAGASQPRLFVFIFVIFGCAQEGIRKFGRCCTGSVAPIG
ncbi:HTH-like domain-containing protein [Salipiger thiooxidans]|uniref:HTH-like domain-containing protein n=1 Tax=Salipiger thiooxidans TaxID=282683 RepID=A0A1G7MBR2_9RHOB|nr:HTH-like domain-containing protein [Salipiger thiooxidans]